MKKRTLQEWADFLDMYVYMAADGNVKASVEKPIFKGESNKDWSSLHIMTVYWYSDPKNTIDIADRAVDYSEYPIIGVLSNRTSCKEPYFVGWDTSLREPRGVTHESREV